MGGRRSQRQLLLALVAGVILGAAVAGGVAVAANGGDDHTFYACERDGHLSQLRMDRMPSCQPGWTLVSWNNEGPQGPPGEDGTDGEQGLPGPAGTLSCSDEQRILAAVPDFDIRDECTPPPPLVAHWTFDDQANPTADSADGHDATVNGATYQTLDLAPIPGNTAALVFNGAGDYLDIADPGGAGNLDGFDGLTVSAWIKPTDLVSVQMIVAKYNIPVSPVPYYLALRGDELELFVGVGPSGAEDQIITTNANIQAGEWTHVAGTWDGSEYKVYVNGVEEPGVREFGPPNGSGTMRDAAYDLRIGAGESYHGFFEGAIDDVRLYKSALPASQIAILATP